MPCPSHTAYTEQSRAGVEPYDLELATHHSAAWPVSGSCCLKVSEVKYNSNKTWDKRPRALPLHSCDGYYQKAESSVGKRNWNTWVMLVGIWCRHSGEELGALLQKLNIESPYDPAIPLLHRHPKEMKAGFQRNVCTLVFIDVHNSPKVEAAPLSIDR